MNDYDTMLIMMPPDLPDDTVAVLWEFLNEINRAFEERYAGQLRRLLDHAENIPPQEPNSALGQVDQDDPF
jgi:hypothetical protein